LTSFLKFDLPERARDMIGEIEVDGPENDSDVADSLTIRGRIVARKAVAQVRFWNGDALLAAIDPPARGSAQQSGRRYEVPIEQALSGLAAGEHEIVIEAVFDDDTQTSRTLALTVIPASAPNAAPR
jgi:hypothetical protein